MFRGNSNSLILLILVLFLTSCGTKKTIVTSKTKTKKSTPIIEQERKKISTPKVVLDNPIKISEPKPYQIEKDEVKKVIVTPINTSDYVSKYAPIAIKEMKLYKIPASITLAQGILESGSGRSELAIRSHNHFGIKCHKGWQGKSVTHDDDEIGECFRKYKYPESSYEDHSKFLTSRKRYSKLFKLKITDYKGWAYGLKRAGYATDPRYPQKLIGLINKYKLFQYDLLDLPTKTKVPVKHTTVKGIHIVSKGDTLYSIARSYGISVKELKRINRLKSNHISIDQELIIK